MDRAPSILGWNSVIMPYASWIIASKMHVGGMSLSISPVQTGHPRSVATPRRAAQC